MKNNPLASFLNPISPEARAIRRTQAVIEFDPDGVILDANPLFLEAVGYAIEEVRGQHHSIFVEPAEHAAPAYKAFSERLAEGEAVFEFDRTGKVLKADAALAEQSAASAAVLSETAANLDRLFASFRLDSAHPGHSGIREPAQHSGSVDISRDRAAAAFTPKRAPSPPAARLVANGRPQAAWEEF